MIIRLLEKKYTLGFDFLILSDIFSSMIFDSHFHITSMLDRGLDATLPSSFLGLECGTEPGDAKERIMAVGKRKDVMLSMGAGPWMLESGDVEKDPESPVGTVIACCNAPGRYSAIVVPQKILNQIPLVEVIVKDVSYLLSSKFVFGSGMRHSLDIVLSDNPDKVLISIGGGVIDWN